MKKLALLGILTLILGAAGLLYYDLHRPYRGYSNSVILVINPGMRAPEVTDLLAARGVLRHRLPFFIEDILGRPRHRSIKAGEYLFDQALTPLQVYWKLVRGDVYLRAILIPEGSDRFEMARIFEEQLGIRPADFLELTQVTGPIRDLDSQAASLEGFLFPDTYRFPRGASAATVVTAMLGRFRHVLESRFPELLRSPDKLHEVVTLASLVEKETPTPTERPLVAGVFTRRLEKGMALQCDPTVVYAARLDRLVSASIDGTMNLNLIAPATDPIKEEELQIDSPYNTYSHAGLPRGPICSPGEASLRAALNPAAGPSLYFVSNNQGGHLFAATLAEHNRNVTRYRRQLAAANTSEERTADEKRGISGALSPALDSAGQPASVPSTSSPNRSGKGMPSGRSNTRTRPAHAIAAGHSKSHSSRQRARHKRQKLSKQEDRHS